MTSHAQIEPIPVSPDDEAESVQPEDENGQAKAEKQAKRKQSAHNTADKSGRVCVAVRMRPLLKTETGGTHFKLKPEKGCVSVFSEVDEVYKPLYFDHVFPPSTCQGTVYSKVAEGFVDDLYRGVSGCVLAYGQTGAGKTYTLLELESYAKLGIIPRLVQAIFDRAEKEASTHDVTIRCSYLQIYMEHVQDLLKPENGNLAVRENANGFFVAKLSVHRMTSAMQVLSSLHKGNKHKTIAPTKMNAHSSRSHTVFTLHLERTERVDTALARSRTSGRTLSKATLTCVDLAGSERASKSCPSGLQASLSDPIAPAYPRR